MKRKSLLIALYCGIILCMIPLPPLSAQVLAYSSPKAKTYRQEKSSNPAAVLDLLLQIKKYYHADILFEESLMTDMTVANYVFDKNISVENNVELLLKSTSLVLKKIRKNSFVILTRKEDDSAVLDNTKKEEPDNKGLLTMPK